jgi:HK97 family phage major capsid protein
MRYERIETKDTSRVDDDEVKAAVGALTATVTDAVKGFDKKLGDLEEKFSRELVKLKRPGAGGAADPSFDTKAFSKALRTFGRSGDETELKAMSVASDPDGGYTVIPQFSKNIAARMFDQSPIVGLCRNVTLGSGDSFVEPRELTDTEASWVGESESRPETDSPQLGAIDVPLNELYACPKITQRVLDDSEFDLDSFLTGKIGDKFGRSMGAAVIAGNGVKQPKGFLTYPTTAQADFVRPDGTLQYVPTADATHITGDALRDIYWAMRAVHRKGATWLMSSATANVVDKLKDGQGNYLWRPGTVAGEAPTLLGRPVEFDENMPAVAAGSIPIAFGNFSAAYIVVKRPGVKLLRDPYSAKPHVLFYAYARFGGQVQNFDALKLLKVASS